MSTDNVNLNGNFSPNASFTCMNREEIMANYDNLPKEYRDIVKDTFVPATIRTNNGKLSSLKYYNDLFAKLQKESTVATYGADHPQAA